MSDPTYLGEFEQLVLLAVSHCGDDAYGMAVRRELAQRAGRDSAIGAVYATLDRLETKGLVASEKTEVGAARAGESRARRRFKITAAGRRALKRSQTTLARMMDGLEFGRA
jgi:DNA-binding PadR family transcriptional regulator